jgi:proteic killer suppression protein
MNITYKSRRLEKSLTDAKEMAKTYGIRAKKVNQRVHELRAAENLAVMKTIPAANCHPLHEDREGQFAVDVSANWRLVFGPNHDPLPKKEDGSVDCENVTEIRILEVTDYH